MKKLLGILLIGMIVLWVSPSWAEESLLQEGFTNDTTESMIAGEVRRGPARGVATENYGSTIKTTVLFDGGYWVLATGDFAGALAATGSASLIHGVNMTSLYDAAGNFIGAKLAP